VTTRRGSAQFEWDEKGRQEMRRIARVVVVAIARAYERELQELFRAPKHGRLYGITRKKLKQLRRFKAGKRKSRPSKVHRASAAGEAPAINTGRLRQSVGHVVTDDANGVTVTVGTSIKEPPYPSYLETGTSKMAARPAWVPALEIVRSKFLQIVNEAIGRTP
jgi:hypothetical protein